MIKLRMPAAEARFVRELADRLGIPATIEQHDVPAFCRERGLSPQAGARAVRGRALQDGAPEELRRFAGRRRGEAQEPVLAELHSRRVGAFKERTGYGIIINTSFNVRGEPIVCTPQDAYLCFMRTEMDVLVLENLILEKEKQPKMGEDVDWRRQYELD